MDSFVFVHIPKTAGTSFRLGADQYFGEKMVYRDYGPMAPETSEDVKEWIYKGSNFWGFAKVFRENGYRYLTGHFPANKYAPLFGVEHMITFMRNPVQRVISEYNHFVRFHGYTDDFQTFYRTPKFISRQLKALHGITWPSLGFIGITERYEDSLRLLNDKYELAIPLLEANMTKESIIDANTLNASDKENIRCLNAGELAVYRQVGEHFKQRTALTEKDHPFVRGMIGGVSHEAVVGWAVFDNTDEPVTIEVLIDGNLIGTVKAKDYRPHLCQIGVHRGGYVGFNMKVPRLKAGNSIECRVAETGQSLIGSPRLVTEKDIGNK